MKKKSRFLVILALALILPVAMMMVIAMSGVERNATPPRPEGPCDIYAAAGNPVRGCPQQHTCVVRVLQRSAIPGYAPVGWQDPGHRCGPAQ